MTTSNNAKEASSLLFLGDTRVRRTALSEENYVAQRARVRDQAL